MGMRCSHIDEVHVGVGNQLRIRPVCTRDVPLTGKRLRLLYRARAYGIGFYALQMSERDGCFLGNPSRSDDSYSHFIHFFCLG